MSVTTLPMRKVKEVLSLKWDAVSATDRLPRVAPLAVRQQPSTCVEAKIVWFYNSERKKSER